MRSRWTRCVSSAGLTESVSASPTTAPPPSERATSAATPASIRPNPAARSASRRHPRARYTPSAIRPSARITRMIASTFKRFTPSCASSSSSECRIVSCAASAGRRSASRPPTPNCAWVCSSSPFRSSVTSPPAVDTFSPPPSSTTWRKSPVGTPIRLLPQLLRARALEQPIHALHSEILERPGGRAGQRLEPRRQRVCELGLYVDVLVELVDQVDRQLAPDLVVLEQLGARIGPVVGVQQLPVRPDGEDRQDRQNGADCDQGQRQRPTPLGTVRGHWSTQAGSAATCNGARWCDGGEVRLPSRLVPLGLDLHKALANGPQRCLGA